MSAEDTFPRGYASPPCFAHELGVSCGEFGVVDDATRRDVMRWRRAERHRLYRLRESLGAARRETEERRIAAALTRLIAQESPAAVSAYWPIRGEPDLRPWMKTAHAAGVRIALPVVVGTDEPLVFRRWRPGARLLRGRWGIAEPADGEPVEPDLVVAPLLGVDANRYRLGNGGGYFDRTLAAAARTPLAVGVGFENSRIDTIYPLPHDIPMQLIITGG